MNLTEYLGKGIENIVKGALKASLKNPRESFFLTKYAFSCKKAQGLREKAKNEGEHVPPFLIASITSSCNLHCKGCYARANHACVDSKPVNQLDVQKWRSIFNQAKDMGVSFILLAGGEPLVRKDVIEAAGKIDDILFPIFTNGTLMNQEYLEYFNQHRNLLPVISVEGNQQTTDERRGDGVYEIIHNNRKAMNDKNIFYGVSITVTTENVEEVTRKEFIQDLYYYGCKVVFYIEYVPVSKETKNLAFTEKERAFLEEELKGIKETYEDMIFIAFPGDEKASGGCLAAGRGFFHINAMGGAEPCPFSPYSDTNLTNVSLKEALNSPLFKKLRNSDILMAEHSGGCVLFEQENLVKNL